MAKLVQGNRCRARHSQVEPIVRHSARSARGCCGRSRSCARSRSDRVGRAGRAKARHSMSRKAHQCRRVLRDLSAARSVSVGGQALHRMDFARDAARQTPATDEFQERKPDAEPCSLTRAEAPHRIDRGYRAQSGGAPMPVDSPPRFGLLRVTRSPAAGLIGTAKVPQFPDGIAAAQRTGIPGQKGTSSRCCVRAILGPNEWIVDDHRSAGATKL